MDRIGDVSRRGRRVDPLREPLRSEGLEGHKVEEVEGELKAVAIGTDEEGDPKLLAIGQGMYAERMIRKAREEGVFVKRDPELTERLSRVGLKGELPKELFDVVSALIYYVWKLDDRLSSDIKRRLR